MTTMSKAPILFCIQADANEAYRIFTEGYQQAVKDMKPKWISVDSGENIPTGTELLCKIKWHSGKIMRAVLVKVEADDHDWLSDGYELSHSINVTDWMPLPEPDHE